MVRRVLWTATGAALLAGCGLFVDLGGLSGEAAGAADGGEAGVSSEAGATASGDGGADAAVASAYRDAVLADRPVSYWPLDEAPGSLVAKDIVSGRDATLTGAATFGVRGVAGTALSVTSRDAFLEVGDVHDLAGQAPFTIEAWAQPKITEDFTNLGAKRDERGQGWILYFRDNGALQFEQRWASGQRVGFSDTPRAYPQPAHVVVTFDGTKLAMYLDGEKLAKTFQDPGSASDLTVPLVWSAGYEGLLDEIAIYDRALPPDRVVAHRAAAGR